MAPPALVEEFKEAMEESLTWKVDIAIETGCARITIMDFPCYDGRTRDVDITMPLRALKGETVSINDIRFRTDSGPFPSPFVMDNGRLQGIHERGYHLNGREEIINLITDVISWDSVGTVARSPWRLAASTCRDEFLRRAILEEVQRYREMIRGIQKPGSDAFLPDDNITRIEVSPKACNVIEELVLGDPRHECGGTLIGSICRDDSTGRTISYVDDVYTDWEYGGSAENRCRYPLEVIKAIRDAIGYDMIIEVRLNGDDKKEGGITPDMLKQISQSYQGTPADRALRNAIGNNSIRALALNQDNLKEMDTHFSVRVNSKGITDQQSSGRCWLFTGLNVMRAKTLARYGFRSFEFSEIYPFFWDQLEKANLFLQGIIDTRGRGMEDETVQWLFKHPLSDGGTFTGVADIVGKYGLVPKEAMPETYSSNNTSQMAELISLKLKEYALRLREMGAEGKGDKALVEEKTRMLGTVYRMLALNLGVPPTEFDYVRRDAQGNPVETEHHTPMTFLEKYGDPQLLTHYVMLMNDPSRPYYKTYEIDYDRHRYDGRNWTYVNLPIEDIKQMAIASLKDSTMMYFSCDVGKFLNSKRGLLDVNNYDYESLMGTTFGMDKKERIQTFSSGSSHAMTLMAVDLDAEGRPTKWMVENSWGASSGYQGHLIMTDEWFDEYMFRLVVETKYVPADVMKLFEQKPERLPAWDPMFAPEE